MSYLLLRDVVDQSVINRTDECILFSGTVPAGLWIGNVLLIEQTGRYKNNNQNSRNYTIRLYLNGTRLFNSQPPSQTASANYYAAMQRWQLVAVGSYAVRGSMMYACGGDASDTGNFATTGAPGGGGTIRFGDTNFLASDRAYVDLGRPVQLSITVQMNNTGAAHEFVSMGIWVLLLGDGLTASVRSTSSSKRRPG